MSPLPVSIVVPCHGRATQMRALLESLRASTARCEIVVVDDASPEPLDRVVAALPELSVKYIRLEANRGAAAARNVGVAASEQAYIGFTDSDCIVSRDWLQHIFNSIHSAQGNIAGVGGRTVAAGSDIFSLYYDYHKILDPWFFRGKNYYVTTANAIFRRAALEAVTGFDESVIGAGGEDPGLCFKLQNAGFGLGYNPDALVYHQYAPSLRAFMKTFYRYGYGCAGQSAKHYRRQPFVQSTGFGGTDIYDGS